MNILDILFVIPLLYFAWRGFSSGLVKELIRIAGFVAVTFISFNYMDTLLPFLKDAGVPETIRPFAASFALFIAGTMVVELIARLMNKLIDVTLLTIPNKMLGLFFGLLKVALFFSFGYIFLAGFNIPDEKTRKSSATYPYLIQVVPVTYDVISSVYPGAENFVETFKKRLPATDANTFKSFFD